MTTSEELEARTVPRSRLRAGWTPPQPAERLAGAGPVLPRAVRPVRDAPERPRAALRRTEPALEERIAPWAVPSDRPAPATPAPPADPGRAGRHRAERRPAQTRRREERHAVYAPAEGAVDLAPQRATPITDPPRRRWFRWRSAR
ncbi:hypothetical protein H9L10_10520 [Phycicoccus endophyticus]|uniref:Uncharacterized protein n=1 Tax=Phycicoccus endophyticus TaxID=1690220 RepID=A0A7G9QZF5_9MICO|nr:hypothetical protein [Phycicoccus endophyticus]NHI19090.1 hypothetical protein [Phycicoccus endophyticus]QNN48730.1 hypothetical protein H9L10_10520 [Phycicoccus endophyticus]GGL32697.1 hypothetical protein GCM10012283_13890 [Phycicoccus endophyticus]